MRIESPNMQEIDYWAELQADLKSRNQRKKTLTAEAFCDELGKKGLLFQTAADVFRDVVLPGTTELVWSGYSWEPKAVGDVKSGEATFALSMDFSTTGLVELEIYEERWEAARPDAASGLIGAILKLDNKGKVKLEIREEDGVWVNLGGSQGNVLEVLLAIRDSFRVSTDSA